MWPLILQFIRTNVRYVALPFAAIVGFIGFFSESWLRSPEAISSSMRDPKQTISEARRKRQLLKDLDTFGNNFFYCF
uniref:Hypotheticial protein n=1 Tax=Schistosoma japonicum TaxID=6182 RepID=C1L420_SCHJA|nr:hypotheticial protein [Schistosoma japonicum]